MQIFLRFPDGLEVTVDAVRDETVEAFIQSAEAKLGWQLTPANWVCSRVVRECPHSSHKQELAWN